MKIKIILLLLFLISCMYPQQDTIKKIFNLDGDIRNPTFLFSHYYPYQYPEGNDLLFELHNDSSSNIYISHYNSELDSFFIQTKITNNDAENINPSGQIIGGDKIVIFQTNLNGNWDIAYREFKNGSWDSIKILSDTTGDETNPVFIDPLPYEADTSIRILYEKNHSIYMYEESHSSESNEIIFKGSDSVIFSLPTGILTNKEKDNQDIKGLKIAAKLDSAGKEKIVSIFKPLTEKADSSYIVVDIGDVNNPKFQMVYTYDPSLYLTYEKGNNIYVERHDYFCPSCPNIIPFKDSIIGKIHNLYVFPLVRPVTKSSPQKYNEVFIGNPNSYVYLRNDSAFIFLYGNYYEPDYYVYSKVKDNHPAAGITGEYEYKEVNYIIWEDSSDQYIQLFGKRVLMSYSDVGEPVKPNNFYLYQNYPNPFNPSTKINFVIPKTSFVILKIFDVLGKEVKTLINESKPIGKYQVEFDGTNLSSGIYFYSLKAGDFFQVKKMILLK